MQPLDSKGSGRLGGRRSGSRAESPTALDTRSLLDASPDVLVELSLDGRTRFVSRAAERILSRSVESMTGVSFLELIVPEDHNVCLTLFRKVVETGEAGKTIFRTPRSDGVRVTFDGIVTSTRDDQGVQRVFVSCRDITDEESARRIEKRRNGQYRAITESGTRAAVILNASLDVLFSNRQFEKIFGRHSNVHKVRSRTGPDATSAIATNTNLARFGASSGVLDFDYHTEDGKTLWFSSYWESCELPEMPDGERAYTVVFDDITRHKRIEIALRTIASRPTLDGGYLTQEILGMMAEALEFDRIVVARVMPNTSGTQSAQDVEAVRIIAGIDASDSIDPAPLDVSGLPDATPAAGEVCFHPTGLSVILPDIRDRLGREFDAYAGVPIRLADGEIFGFIGGYSIGPIADVNLTKSLLTAYATHLAAVYGYEIADQEIVEKRTLFQTIANEFSDMLVEVDSNDVISFISNASLPILGIPPEQVVGKRVIDFAHPDDQTTVRGRRKAVRAGEPTGLDTLRVRHADGSYRQIETRTVPFRGTDGLGRALLIARDVTHRSHTDLGRDLLYRVVQKADELVAVCALDTTIHFANEQANRTLIPAQNEQLEGRTLSSLLETRDARRLRDEIFPQLETSSTWTGELEFESIDGRDAIVAQAKIFLLDEHQNGETPPFVAVTLNDVTANKNTEEALRLSELRLGQAQRMEAVGRLTGGIAHDFNNLLTAIIGYSDLVLDQLGPNHRVRTDALEILRAAERAGALTRQLLDFGRQQTLPRDQDVDLNRVLANIDRMMRRLIVESIEVVTLQDGGIWNIWADESQIEQVIVNLAVNARDAMPNGGRLELETRNLRLRQPTETVTGPLCPGDYVVLRVSDTGIGMDADTREKIFEAFFTTKSTRGGTGLGLATVCEIVTRNGGQVDVASAPGRGTTFSVYFPAHGASTEAIAQKTADAFPGGHETILLVEDSAAVRILIERTLAQKGYKVLAAESASAALRYSGRFQDEIHLLLSDVVLPRSSGPEIAARVRSHRPSLKTLFMSGFPDETFEQYGLSRDEIALIEKPFTPGTALTAIREMLDGEPSDAFNTTFPVEQIQ